MMLSTVRYVDSVDYQILDILSQFPVQYAFLAFIVLVICIWKKFIRIALFAAFLVAINMIVLVDSGNLVQAAGHGDRTLTVYSANINKNNNDLSKLLKEVTANDDDIVLLLEVTKKNIDFLQPLIRKYPHRLINLNIGSSGIGTVLMSKFPILNHEVTKYSDFGNMLVSVTLGVNDKRVIMYAVHFPRPLEIPDHARMEQFMSLAQQVRGQSAPVIVAGDFNETLYSPIFKRLLSISGLNDSRGEFGWLPSWPTFFPPLWIPIDHILVSPGIHVLKRATGSYIGSDHYPVFAELSIN